MFKAIIVSILMVTSIFAKTQIIDNLNGTQHIDISRTDVNRLVFQSGIKYQANSKEKDLTISVLDKEMFVKFTPYKEEELQQQPNSKDTAASASESKILYDKSKPSELFVVTDEKTYSIVLHPVEQESTTIMFTESLKEKKEKLFINKDAEYVKDITNNLIKPVLQGVEIQGFEKKELNESSSFITLNSNNLDLEITSKAFYKGYKYNLYEYSIKNHNKFALTISDSKELLEFSVEKVKKKIVAYSIFYNNRIYKILPNQSAKLLIVYGADND